MLNDGFVHKDLIEPYLEDGKLIEENCRICVEKEQYNSGDTFGKHINEYNGDCTLLVLKGTTPCP